jgi:GGDEF domain-containing protein
MQLKTNAPILKTAPLPLSALRQAIDRINEMKRTFDLLAHYETDHFALLLSDADPAGACRLIARIINYLLESPLAPDIDPKMLHLAFGVASCPDDCTSAGRLLASAECALAEAVVRGTHMLKYSDIPPPRSAYGLSRQAV